MKRISGDSMMCFPGILCSAATLVLVLALVLADKAAGGALPEPSNRVGSLLEALAETKVHRWEPAADRITLISLDAIPEALWQGTLRDLKKMDRKARTARFQARADSTKCTDVSAAFRLAVQDLDGDARYVGKYLFAFTDLIHEPPMTSIKKCRPPARPCLPTTSHGEACRAYRSQCFRCHPSRSSHGNGQ
jgi:hypothetical protein